MSTHLENIKKHIPNIEKIKVLDLGSGKGKFLVELATIGGNGVGLETSQGYIDKTYARAKEASVVVKVIKGMGENLPFENNSFNFVNMSEVIEHVQNPEKVMREVNRVITVGGNVYISAPSRFSLKDPHFHLYFVNWMPRFLSDAFISVFGKHKDYNVETGNQRLKELHYFTDKKARMLFKVCGFETEDIREKKIKEKISNSILQKSGLWIYKIFAPAYFDTYHYLLKKI